MDYVLYQTADLAYVCVCVCAFGFMAYVASASDPRQSLNSPLSCDFCMDALACMVHQTDY